ncbi:hypothetical protein ACOCJ4_15460 [Knoellia sp. CPCC 206435]|uniref:hypothetical protein n=1 Tax=Knoellia terrae TaxID=3404797 RepID=UPI003B434BB7
MDAREVIDITGGASPPRVRRTGRLSSLTVRDLLGYLAACEGAAREGAEHVRAGAMAREQERILGELHRRLRAGGGAVGLRLVTADPRDGAAPDPKDRAR